MTTTYKTRIYSRGAGYMVPVEIHLRCTDTSPGSVTYQVEKIVPRPDVPSHAWMVTPGAVTWRRQIVGLPSAIG